MVVRWVSQCLRPFEVIADEPVIAMLKSGRPASYRLPHPTTVSRDTKNIFAKTRSRIAKFLQVSRVHNVLYVGI